MASDENKERAAISAPSDELLASKKLEKLTLEIENLRKRHKRDLVALLVPLISTAVLVAGFFFTVVQYGNQRQKEQEQAIIEQQKDRQSAELELITRLQTQIRSDIEQILRFPRDPEQTVSKVSFLLEDIKAVFASRVEGQGLPTSYRRALTKSMVIMIRDDCDFSGSPRDVGLANIVVGRWNDYSAYLEKEPGKLEYILYEYTRALQTLRDQTPGYLEGMTLDNATGQFETGRYEQQEDEPTRYNYFVDISDGFKMHLAILKGQSKEARELRERRLREFQAVLCNEAISTHMFGTYFPEQPCAASH